MASFVGILEKYEDHLWNYHIKVPEEIVKSLKLRQHKWMVIMPFKLLIVSKKRIK